MNEEALRALGIQDETIKSVMDMYNDAIKNHFVPITRFNEVNEAKKNAETTVQTMSGQLEALKKIDAESLKVQIEQLQKDNKAMAEKHANEMTTLKMNNFIDSALLTAKAKNATAVKALLSMDELKFENEKLTGLDAQIKKLKEADDTKFLFEEEQKQQNSFTGTKPGQQGGNPAEENKGALFAQMYNSKMGVTAKE